MTEISKSTIEKTQVKFRQPMKTPIKEQDPYFRIKNFIEVSLGYNEEEAIQEATRCLNCKKPICVKGCPVDIDIPGFINAIINRDFKKGIGIIKKTNILPSICGRVCPQEKQCEEKCILGRRKGFEPVAIGKLERFLADWERENGISIPEIALLTGRKVAIIGSGPAGLTCACDLARHGHEITIFESFHKAGGVLIYGIPEFRLPKNIINDEINLLKKMGIIIKVNTVIGVLLSTDDLFEMGYDAIFIATGAGLPRNINVKGTNLSGVYFANEFLTRVNLMEAYKFPDESDTPINLGKKVATIGAGNVAIDCARTALRLGAEKSYIVYRRSIIEAPARQEEIHHAKEEGVIFKFLLSPLEIIGDEKGNVTGIKCQKHKLGKPDKSGRCKPKPIDGACFDIDVDTIIIAIGQHPNPLIPRFTKGLEIHSWGGIIVNEETGETSISGIFAGGDIVKGSATVISAMGDGRRAAKAINNYLLKKKSKFIFSKLISRENLPLLIDSMLNDLILIAPINKNNVISFAEITSSQEVYFGNTLPMIPLKKLFHPAKQELFTFNRKLGVDEICIKHQNFDILIKNVVFGVRPCDITGNNIIDEIFSENFKDEFYNKLREKTLIIGIKCLKPCYGNCFCESMSSNDPKSGYDLMLTEIREDEYIIVPNSDGGKRILRLYPELFAELTSDDFEQYVRTLELKKNNFKKEILVEGLPSELEDKYESDIWNKFTKNCIFCGSCTFVCPTCYCFNVKDNISIDLISGVRLREWDSCYYPEFAKVAGGHDYRPEKKHRFRYRYIHKYIGIPRRYNIEGCVGCGRCITYCPAKIDVKQVLKAVRGES
ncbi:MAG: NADPH-dependent glutamate synthase [Candidatus Heimdallarchaeota archaeon]|nr:NADPH-dependent glutamate synthase [Candidatus Heimdallarchaeota archaeon]